jgi:hypothetical protein
LAWANGRGKRLIKEEKQKKVPPERKNQGPSLTDSLGFKGSEPDARI